MDPELTRTCAKLMGSATAVVWVTVLGGMASGAGALAAQGAKVPLVVAGAVLGGLVAAPLAALVWAAARAACFALHILDETRFHAAGTSINTEKIRAPAD